MASGRIGGTHQITSRGGWRASGQERVTDHGKGKSSGQKQQVRSLIADWLMSSETASFWKSGDLVGAPSKGLQKGSSSGLGAWGPGLFRRTDLTRV